MKRLLILTPALIFALTAHPTSHGATDEKSVATPVVSKSATHEENSRKDATLSSKHPTPAQHHFNPNPYSFSTSYYTPPSYRSVGDLLAGKWKR